MKRSILVNAVVALFALSGGYVAGQKSADPAPPIHIRDVDFRQDIIVNALESGGAAHGRYRVRTIRVDGRQSYVDESPLPEGARLWTFELGGGRVLITAMRDN